MRKPEACLREPRVLAIRIDFMRTFITNMFVSSVASGVGGVVGLMFVAFSYDLGAASTNTGTRCIGFPQDGSGHRRLPPHRIRVRQVGLPFARRRHRQGAVVRSGSRCLGRTFFPTNLRSKAPPGTYLCLNGNINCSTAHSSVSSQWRLGRNLVDRK